MQDIIDVDMCESVLYGTMAHEKISDFHFNNPFSLFWRLNRAQIVLADRTSASGEEKIKDEIKIYEFLHIT